MNPYNPQPLPEGDDQNSQQPPQTADGSGAGELIEGGVDAASGALDVADAAGSVLDGLGGCAEGCGACSLAVLLMLFVTASTAFALFR